jgi:hypothetical protein
MNFNGGSEWNQAMDGGVAAAISTTLELRCDSVPVLLLLILLGMGQKKNCVVGSHRQYNYYIDCKQ